MADGPPAGSRSSAARMLAVALAVVGAFLVLRVGLIWLHALCQIWIPSWLGRQAALTVLHALRVGYAFAVIAATLGVVLPALAIVRARMRNQRLPGSARWLLLGLSMLLGLALLETGAKAWLNWVHRLPDLPTKLTDSPRGQSGSTGAGDLSIVVVGESSALGVPYEPWLSVPQILGWQLEQLAPGRRVTIDNRAVAGICLEQAVAELWNLSRRPDAIVIYAGHNEFQARYGWSRNVRYYAEEGPKRPRNAVLAWCARASWLCRLIDETQDKYRTALGPPPNVKRALVDHPSFIPEEYAHLRSEFHRRLEGVVAYCEHIGALPILIIPPGNEAEFPPSRSYLSPNTSQSERQAATEAFFAVRALEESAPAQAMAAYEKLLSRHPHFAEVHYRLGRLLRQAGRLEQAQEHFLLARDDDGLPMRCPSDFLSAYRQVAARHDVVLVDGPAVFRKLVPDGILDYRLFHDGQHPTLRGYLALAQNILEQSQARGAFGLERSTRLPPIDPDECARHFGLNARRWAAVCEHTTMFHNRVAELRYDPSELLGRASLYVGAWRKIEAGALPDDVGVPGLGLHPPGLVDSLDSMRPLADPAR